MKTTKLLVAALLAAAMATPSEGEAQNAAVVLHADRVLDGRGGVQEDRDVVVQNGRIVEVLPGGQGRGEVRYDLAGLTLMPGLIDTHVHINWHFDRETGKTHSGAVEETPQETVLYAAQNAYETLMSGVTTVQSLGSPVDIPLRDFVKEGRVPGPRILTSISAVNARTGGPAEIRRHVGEMADQGADVIKIFASASIRDGGAPTLTQEQLDAACGEARARGLRAFVHAYDPETVRRVVQAECTGVEHGALLDLPSLKLMAEHGVYFDPNIDLVFRNYFENSEHFVGVGNYTDEGFAEMRKAVPLALRVFQEGLTVPGLKMVFGTDAVAGAHGRNYQELVYRIKEGGQDPMDAIVSGTSLAAEGLGLADRLGSIAPGMEADLIALDGDPLRDPEALGRVLFVMKGGRVYKNVRGSH
jgi:imidazolonepropionase-like amidohydrolase